MIGHVGGQIPFVYSYHINNYKLPLLQTASVCLCVSVCKMFPLTSPRQPYNTTFFDPVVKFVCMQVHSNEFLAGLLLMQYFGEREIHRKNLDPAGIPTQDKWYMGFWLEIRRLESNRIFSVDFFLSPKYSICKFLYQLEMSPWLSLLQYLVDCCGNFIFILE